jgi:hypothetical protein
MLTSVRSDVPMTMVAAAPRPRDIRHLIVCPHPIGPHHSAIYLAAREQVVRDCSHGDAARIVLVTSRSRNVGPLPFDIPVDILPVFTEPGRGQHTRINRAIFACIFSSARPDTVFQIHASRHPILTPIIDGLRTLGIAYSVTTGNGSPL